MGEVCAHVRTEYHCRPCKGAGTCPHSSNKNGCGTYPPDVYCEHNYRKDNCPTCPSKPRCDHDMLSSCLKCGPTSTHICVHDLYKYNCDKCRPSGYCKHGNVTKCKRCEKRFHCLHDAIAHRCVECHPNLKCEHGTAKNKCRECKIVEITRRLLAEAQARTQQPSAQPQVAAPVNNVAEIHVKTESDDNKKRNVTTTTAKRRKTKHEVKTEPVEEWQPHTSRYDYHSSSSSESSSESSDFEPGSESVLSEEFESVVSEVSE